ncbi:hypothetical protein Lal_00027807 [Lupinus albus]|nr:hypothetical protein Lal_00027807 [Lupinus albus]
MGSHKIFPKVHFAGKYANKLRIDIVLYATKVKKFFLPQKIRKNKIFKLKVRNVTVFRSEDGASMEVFFEDFPLSVIYKKSRQVQRVGLGKDIVLDIKTFSSICCDIQMTCDVTGFGLVCDWDDYDRKRFYLYICRIPKEEIERRKQQSLGETIKNRDILSAGYLTLEERLVHYFLSYVILPKFSNHSQISDIDLYLMYAIKYNIKINCSHMIMSQIWNVRSSQSPLPYAIFITKILEHFGVSLDGETKVALNLRESNIDIEVVHKMGLVIDPVTRRNYKHRTDRQTAPTDQPEPSAPNQPEFQAPSSSSVVMPSNQMIMDELVSLRGYITTRMDAIDTQNHQIHYELHRLSSRLNSMDIDVDSSDPES